MAKRLEDIKHITDVPAGNNLFESMEHERSKNRPKLLDKTLYQKDYQGHEIHPSEG